MLAGWAADGAERALPLFEAQAPADTRPRAAIDALRAFSRGELRIGAVRAAGTLGSLIDDLHRSLAAGG